MTAVLITVDTELSALLHQRGATVEQNYASSIAGEAGGEHYGIGWQMDCLERYGLNGVYFVDPLPALVYGPDVIAKIVAPIIARGHEVQLHIHSEWLEWAKESPVANRRGRNIGDFSYDDQLSLIGAARDILVAAGAPQPTAFRAGNYGASDNTIRALATLGLAWDSSFNPTYLGKPCTISLSASQVDPVSHHGVTELPIAALHDMPGNIRAAQICALSAREMREALYHAAETHHPAFVIVTHSFEMLSRDRSRPNYAVMARFDAMCRVIADHPSLECHGFGSISPSIVGEQSASLGRLGPNRLRTFGRMAEQALATWRYERKLRPI